MLSLGHQSNRSFVLTRSKLGALFRSTRLILWTSITIETIHAIMIGLLGLSIMIDCNVLVLSLLVYTIDYLVGLGLGDFTFFRSVSHRWTQLVGEGCHPGP